MKQALDDGFISNDKVIIKEGDSSNNYFPYFTEFSCDAPFRAARAFLLYPIPLYFSVSGS